MVRRVSVFMAMMVVCGAAWMLNQRTPTLQAAPVVRPPVVGQAQSACQIFSETAIPSPGRIRFEETGVPSTIGTFYRAQFGVSFENSGTTRAIVYGNEPTEARSAPNVAINNAVSPNTSAGVPLAITFDSAKTHVGFWLGNGETQQITALVTAFNAAGGVICQVRIAVPEPHTTFTGISDSTGSIRKITLDYGQTLLAESIDDLTFAPFTAQNTATPTRTATRTATRTVTVTPSRTATATATRTATRTPTTGPVLPPIFAIPYEPIFVGPIVAAPPASDLAVHGIEITQGIQCFNPLQGLATCPDNSLPVVAKKETTARIYLKYTSPSATSRTNVPVRFVITANGVEYVVNATGRALAAINQADTTNSVNIYFNVNFSSDVPVQFYAIVDPNNAITENNEGNNRFPASGAITLNFRTRRTLDVVSRRVRYHPSGYTGTQYAGGWAVNGGGADWWEQLLPIRTGGIDHSIASGYLDWTTRVSGGTGPQNSAGQHALIQSLNTSWLLQNIFGGLFGGAFSNADHVYGWVPSAAWGGGHADMPVYPHAGGLGVVGIGTDNPGTSTDNPGSGAVILGHELTHDYDTLHTNTPDACGSTDGNSTFPYSSSSIQEFGFNPITGKVYNPASTHDLMSYCPPGSKEGWISPFTWNRMFNRLALNNLTQAAPETDTLAVAGLGETLLVNATLSNPALTGQDLGQLDTLYRIPTTRIYTIPQGPYTLQLLNGRQVLATVPFSVSFQSEYHSHGGASLASASGLLQRGPTEEPGTPEPSAFATVSFAIPWPVGTTRVAIFHNGVLLDERQVSTNAPVVAITSPSSAVTWTTGTTQTLRWEASDDDGDALRYAVFYSPDGLQWDVIASELTTPTLELLVDGLAGSSTARFRVVATDGINTTNDETDAAINVPNKAPEANITNPAPNALVETGGLLLLTGFASDLEDGMLAEGELRWSSNRQGDLGTGAALAINTLQSGAHTLTLTVTDSDGAATTRTVDIFVGVSRTYLPFVRR